MAGAVLKHSRDFNLTRESVLGSRLDPRTPAYDIQQACGTGLEAAILVANKIALGQIEAGIAGGVDTTSDAPLGVNEDMRRMLLELNRARSLGARLRAVRQAPPGPAVQPDIPRNAEPRTGLSMGEHAALTALQLAVDRRGPGRAGARLAPAASPPRTSAASSTTCDALPRPDPRPEPAPRHDAGEARRAQARLRPGRRRATMTAGNSSPLTDGASAVLLASEEWAAERGTCPCWRTSTPHETAAVDFVHGGEGLLMAPAYAVPRMLDRAGLTLQDFDFYEIHEAFASQVLATLTAWEDPSSARSGSASTRRSAPSTAPGSTSTARRWPPATRSPRPAAGSWPRWRSCSPRRAPAAA